MYHPPIVEPARQHRPKVKKTHTAEHSINQNRTRASGRSMCPHSRRVLEQVPEAVHSTVIIILNTKSIIFSTKSIIFNAKSIIFNAKFFILPVNLAHAAVVMLQLRQNRQKTVKYHAKTTRKSVRILHLYATHRRAARQDRPKLDPN